MHRRHSPRIRLARCTTVGLLLVAIAGRLTAQVRDAVVHGVVRDSAGDAILGAEVAVGGRAERTTTNAAGAFRLITAAGAVQLTVRRLGFQPWSGTLSLRSGEDQSRDVVLASVSVRLPAVTVRERREAFDSRLAGFNERRAKKVGYFISRERLEATQSFRLTDLLREIPGVRIGSTRGSSHSLRLRGASCPPLVYIDGIPATSGEFDLDIIDPRTVEGLEIYSSMMSVPAEFAGPADLTRCGVVAIWSKPFRSTRRAAATDRDSGIGTAPIYAADSVDLQAVLDTVTAAPIYPDSLLTAGVSGRAMLEFVVSVSGRVEVGSIVVVSATDPAFARSARTALAGARFEPARLNGAAVRERVQLPFVFEATAGVRKPD